MSKPNEERDIYYIPPNFLASGRLFGGMIRARNAIEACVLVLLTGIPIIKLPMSLTVRIIILCLLPLPLGIFGIIGFEGDSLSEFAINWVRWFIHRRSLYRSDVTIPETARKQKKRIWEQEATKPPEELGIRIKQPRKKRKRPTKTEKQLNKNNRKMVPSHKKQVTYSEDFVPVKDILNGIIETEDGRYIRVLEVEPINFLLRSTSEQKNIVASFASWMKISPIRIQIKVLTKKADIGKHLNTIERDMESESMMASISHEHANQYTGELLPPSPASAPYAIFRQSSETVRTSVIIGLGSKLAVLQAQQVRNITSYNEIDLELPGKQKCAYFCIVSDQDSTYDFLSSLFFSFLFIRLIRYADAYCEGGMLHPKVKFILDEFPNCCLIPDVTKKCSTATSHSLSRNRTNNWKEVSSHDRNNLFRPEEWHDVQPSQAEPRQRSPRACC